MANVPGIPVYKEIGATPAPATATDTARVVIVGAGPVGLAMALDLGRRGHEVVVLTRLDFIAHASKAICFSQRSLAILDRLVREQRRDPFGDRAAVRREARKAAALALRRPFKRHRSPQASVPPTPTSVAAAG